MLKCFDLICFGITSERKVTVRVNILRDGIELSYFVSNKINDLLIQKKNENPIRQWNLWEHTCFEFFLKRKNHRSYLEFNFAPSGNWNVFFLKDFRCNEGEYDPVCDVNISSTAYSDEFSLQAFTSFDVLEPWGVDDFKAGLVEISLSAVLEKKNGDLEYWALWHPELKPDFHQSFLAI